MFFRGIVIGIPLGFRYNYNNPFIDICLIVESIKEKQRMRMNNRLFMSVVLIFLFTITYGSALAGEYKMSTKIPPGIATPDTVETRLGTLRFFDGFPDNATVEKLYDNLDFQRAVQAYLLGLAPVNQVANRKGMLEVGPANTTVPIFETDDERAVDLPDPEQQHAVHMVLARPAQGPAGPRGSAEGPRADRRHVVSLCHRCGHGGAGQGRGRQVSAASARL